MTNKELMEAMSMFPDNAELKSYAELQVELARLKEANKTVAAYVENLIRENHALREKKGETNE